MKQSLHSFIIFSRRLDVERMASVMEERDMFSAWAISDRVMPLSSFLTSVFLSGSWREA